VQQRLRLRAAGKKQQPCKRKEVVCLRLVGMNRSLVLCTAASGTSTVVDSSSGATVMNYFSSEDAVLRSSCVAQTALGFILQHSNKPHMHLYNWAKKQPTTRCAAPEPILCMCSDASNNFVLAGSASGKGYIWSSSTGDLLAQWNAHFSGVSCVAVTHDAVFVVTGGEDGLVKVIHQAQTRFCVA
jgi:WD40 repeat protein